SPANVTYAAGFEAPLQLGPIWEIASWLPPALVLVSGHGDGFLVAADAYAGVAARGWFDRVHSYETLGHFDERDPPASFRRPHPPPPEEAAPHPGPPAGRVAPP